MRNSWSSPMPMISPADRTLLPAYEDITTPDKLSMVNSVFIISNLTARIS